MPFVSSKGGERLNWDITYTKHDPRTGEIVELGNGLKDIELTGGTGFDYQPHGDQYHEIIWRGQPDPVKMCWNELPVYRVLTHRFTSGMKLPKDKEDLLKTDWGRFMRDYEKAVNGLLPTKVFFFEPHLTDIREAEDNPYSLPMWVIDKLIEWGEFDNALKTNKVNLPRVPRLTKLEYDRIMKAIEERKELGNIFTNSKQSKKPASTN